MRHLLVLFVMAVVACGTAGPGEDAPTAVPGAPAPSGDLGQVTAGDGAPSDVDGAGGVAAPGEEPAVEGPVAEGVDPAAPPAAADPSTVEAGAEGGGQAPADGGSSSPAVPPHPAAPGSVALQADGPVGAACRGILRPDIPRLVVEVDAQDGAALPPGPLDHLRSTIVAVADKPGGVEVLTGRIEGGPRDWTLEEIRAVAAASRDAEQSASAASIHVLSLAGRPDQGDDRIASSIGIAFNATEFVVFPQRIDGLATLIGGRDAVLRSVLVHELGHLLCLVNIGMTSAIDHEDPAHPGHSANQGSVMFHAVETTAVGQIFTGPPPDAFDADDLDDLAGLRTGRY